MSHFRTSSHKLIFGEDRSNNSPSQQRTQLVRRSPEKRSAQLVKNPARRRGRQEQALTLPRGRDRRRAHRDFDPDRASMSMSADRDAMVGELRRKHEANRADAGAGIGSVSAVRAARVRAPRMHDGNQQRRQQQHQQQLQRLPKLMPPAEEHAPKPARRSRAGGSNGGGGSGHPPIAAASPSPPRTLLHTARPGMDTMDGDRSGDAGGGRVAVETMISFGKGTAANQDYGLVHEVGTGISSDGSSGGTRQRRQRPQDRGRGAAGAGCGSGGSGGADGGGSLLVGVFDGHGNAGHKVSRAAAKALQKALDRNLARGPLGTQQPSTTPVVATDVGGTDGTGSAVTRGDGDSGDIAVRAMYDALKACTPALKRSTIDTTYSGTTAVAALKHDGHIIVGNIGDSRAVLGRRVRTGGGGANIASASSVGAQRAGHHSSSSNSSSSSTRVKAVDLSYDHTPEYDQERLRKMNGRVHPSIVPAGPGGAPCYMGPTRVWDKGGMHGLAMARSLGDTHLSPYVCAEPEVTRKVLDRDDKFVIVASDGLWGVVNSQEAVEIAASHSKPKAAAKALTQIARQRWHNSTNGCMSDDITVSVARL